MRTKVLLSVLVLFSLLASCNMPAGLAPITQPPQNGPTSVDPNALATAVEMTTIARLTQIAGSAVPAVSTSTPIPTPTFTLTSIPVAAGPCTPLVTAAVNANVRSGPDTAYEIVGSLTIGQTATIVGRNDAFTWWYIDYPGVAGNHAWVAGTVVTSSCVPAVVQVVAAPPTPTVVPVADAPDDGPAITLKPNLQVPLLQLASPDLVAAGMQVSPSPATQNEAVSVQVKVKNTGSATASNFIVQWWASSSEVGCSWTISSLAAGASVNRTCSYTYGGFGTGYSVQVVADAGGTVAESNEGNNSKGGSLNVMAKLQINPNLLKKPILPKP